MKEDKTNAINLFEKLPGIGIAWLLKLYPFSEKIITDHSGKMWWKFLTQNKNVNWSESLINKTKDDLDWQDYLWSNPKMPISIAFVEAHMDKINFEELSLNTGNHWSPEFILHFKDKWNLHWLLLNQSINFTQDLFITLNLFKERISIVNGIALWTEEFILKHMHSFKWFFLNENPHLPWSQDLIEKLKPIMLDRLPVMLFLNKGMPWSIELIEKYLSKDLIEDERGYWSGLSYNESLPWNEDLVARYETNWDWEMLSGNNKVGFNLNQIEKYKDKLLWKRKHVNFGCLSDNTSLDWSEELIDKYIDKWDWEGLAENEGIFWTDKMIEKYKDRLNYQLLFRSPSLPWSFDFLKKYISECKSAWGLDEHSEKCREIVWDKVFAKYIDEEYVVSVLDNLPDSITFKM
ncbi:MAG: hypothetical protein IPP81_09250 [Chitinophagaceae bacterium]|nr:hypothetical protein [Chitinophagaceae bacterium]